MGEKSFKYNNYSKKFSRNNNFTKYTYIYKSGNISYNNIKENYLGKDIKNLNIIFFKIV